MQERLQKIISAAGIASRRNAEEMIEQGRVRVNGELVRQLGTKADRDKDQIQVDGKPLRPPSAPLYLMLNKPRGCVTTRKDPEGRPTVMDLMGRYRSKVYPVGRLDYHSEGLLLFTNDGAFADSVLSAKSLVPKTYHVKIKGRPTLADLDKLREGIRLDGRPTAAAKIHLLRKGDNPWYEVTLIEGRNNQIRRMFQQRGFLVEKLKRVKIGSLGLGKLPPRQVRPLTEKEVAGLRRRAGKKGGSAPARNRTEGTRGRARPRRPDSVSSRKNDRDPRVEKPHQRRKKKSIRRKPKDAQRIHKTSPGGAAPAATPHR